MKLNQNDIGSKIKDLGLCENGYRIMAFTPSLGELFYNGWFPFKKTAKQIARYIFEYFQGKYTVYYLVNDEDEMVGQCMAQKTGYGRYAALGKDAYMIGPYIIRKEFRGNGLAAILIAGVLKRIPKEAVVYDWIHKDNYASIATTKKLGGEAICGIKLSKFLHRFHMGDLSFGDYLLFKFIR